MAKKNQTSENFIYHRLLSSMSAAEKKSFTDTQLLTLQRACKKLAPRKHRVNIRMSIPLPYWPGIYFVLLAGAEKRTLTRIRQERKMFWRAFIIISGMLALLFSLFFSTPKLIYHLNSIAVKSSAPTALPWIQTESECQKSGQVWDGSACWDKQHDRTF